MDRQFRFEGFWVRAVNTLREINYEVRDCQGYVCRLVPGFNGFELSKLDQCLGLNVTDQMILVVSEQI